jgi:DNA-directed RNA polymerase subunit alpha
MSNKGQDFEIPAIYDTIIFPDEMTEEVIIPGKKSIISIYPLKKGFGTTMANSLRRTLLSSVHGACVSGIKIKGITHEFSPIQGAKEDVSTLIANLKKLAISLEFNEEKRISFKIEKKGPFTAGMIPLSKDIAILNPEQHLLECVSVSTPIEIELLITNGFGYVPATNAIQDDEKEYAMIHLDCYYSPVTNVSFVVDEQMVSSKKNHDNYDKVVLTIETNGSIAPKDALKISSYLIRQHLKFVIDFTEKDLGQVDSKQLDINPNLIKKVTELELSVRASNCLRSESITFVGELVQFTESDLIKTPNFGKKSLDEIKEVLESVGLSLGMTIENWQEIKEKYILSK